MPASVKPVVDFRIFRGVYITFDELFAQAAAFASEIGPDRLISISHSEDQNDGVVTVWFWHYPAPAPEPEPAPAQKKQPVQKPGIPWPDKPPAKKRPGLPKAPKTSPPPPPPKREAASPPETQWWKDDTPKR